MSVELRILRSADGKERLQQLVDFQEVSGNFGKKWKDVPVFDVTKIDGTETIGYMRVIKEDEDHQRRETDHRLPA